MLSRICNSSLKFVAFKQIANHTHGYLAPASFCLLSQKCNYGTENDGIIKETKTILTKEKTSSNNGDNAITIENYTNAGNLKDALNILKQARTNNESFKLYSIQVAELVKLLIKENHPFEEVEAVLSEHSPSKLESCFSLFENLMSRLAVSGEVELLQKLFDALVKYNYIEANIESTGHLIKASLRSGAYDQAVDLYEYMDKTYQICSMTMALLGQFIQRKEDDLVQRVYKVFENRYDKRKALCWLGFAYVECRNVQKAKEIFKKVDVISFHVISECQRYVRHGSLLKAKTLLIATQGINCNRDVIYEAILDIYIKQNKALDALNLWREFTNDDILPTQKFKEKLVTLLKANSIEIPLNLDLNNEKKKSDGNKTESVNGKIPLKTSKTYTNNQSLKLDCQKVAELIKPMVESKCPFEEIEVILSANSPSKPDYHLSSFESQMGRLVFTGEVQLVKQLFDALIKYNYIEANVKTTGYLVRGLLNIAAYGKALDIFEHVAKTYQLLPMSKVLFTQLIQHNETDLLKRLFLVCEQKFNTKVAYCILSFSFIECGNDRKARQIFEKFGVSWKDVILHCEEYVKRESLQKARTLLTATKGLNCNRDVIYETILDICIKQNKTQEALNLWREYTNDETLQTQAFKKKLVTLLETNRIKIPLDLDLNSEKEKIEN